MDAIKTLKNAAGDVLRVYFDIHADSPRTWDNVGQFVAPDRDSCLPDEYDAGIDFNCREDDEKRLDSNPDIVAWLPVYAYDHSGIALSCTPFSCRWDSGQVGYIVVTRDQLRKSWITWTRITQRRREVLENWLRSEVEVYSKWLNGDVYGYTIENADGSDGDSCWEFYSIEDITGDFPEFVEVEE